MKLSRKLTLLVMMTALLPLIGIATFSYSKTRDTLNKQIRVQIEATSDRQSKNADDLIDRSAARLNIFSNRLQLRLLLDQYNKTGGIDTRAKLEQNLADILQEQKTYQKISIVNPGGNVVVSTDTFMLGNNYANREEFLVGKQKVSTSFVYKDQLGVVRQRLVAPLNLEGKVIGVAMIDVTMDGFNLLTSDNSGLGNTGESYLVRQQSPGKYQYVTALRFNEKAALTPVKGGIDAPKDYRNHNILASERTLKNGWMLVTKIDSNEVNAPVLALRRVFVLIVVVTLLAVSFLAWYISRSITSPIGRFIETVTQIRHGDLSQRVTVESKDEIGLLSTAFNEMTDHLEESRARLLASISGLKQGFVMVDKQGVITLVNEAAQEMLKFSNTAASDKLTIVQAMHDLTGIDVKTALESCVTECKYVDVANVHFEGSILRIFLSPVVVDNDVTGAVVLVVDETEAHILQRSRDEFFSIASHELRTPLTAIRGNTSMIQDYFPEQLKDTLLAEMIGDIHDSSIRLIEIVNDFLDVSRLEQDKIKFVYEVFDLSKIIESVVYETHAVANEKNTHIALDKRLSVFPEIYADKNRVKQIVYNLLGNALKFTENGTITVTTTSADGLLKVVVNDTGPGISDEGQKLLFHKFQQAGNSLFTRDTSRGTGLGLYISKLLVEKMGGSIALDHSEVGKGSAFSFTIPIATDEMRKHAVADAITTEVPAGKTTDKALEKISQEAHEKPVEMALHEQAPEKVANPTTKAPENLIASVPKKASIKKVDVQIS